MPNNNNKGMQKPGVTIIIMSTGMTTERAAVVSKGLGQTDIGNNDGDVVTDTVCPLIPPEQVLVSYQA